MSCMLVAVPAAASAQQLQTWTINSRYVDPAKATFNSPPPGAPARPPALRVDVLLPDGYDGTRRFPVLYLLHGHGDSYDSWINAQKGDLLHVAPHFPGIVVMPEAATGWYTNWWDGGARGSDGRAWESYFLDEVIPMAESRLRIASGRSNHAIAGLSMGGEGAMFFAEALPGYFGSAASFSGAISLQRPEWPNAFDTQGQNHLDVYGDPTAQQFYWTGHNPTALAANLVNTRLFVRVGDGTPVPYYDGEATNYFGAVAESELNQHAQDFVGAARADGEDVTFEPTTGVHDWPYWRLAMQSALNWGFFKPVDETPSKWSYATVAQQGKAWDIGYRLTSRPDAGDPYPRRRHAHGHRSGHGLHLARRPRAAARLLPVHGQPRPDGAGPNACGRRGLHPRPGLALLHPPGQRPGDPGRRLHRRSPGAQRPRPAHRAVARAAAPRPRLHPAHRRHHRRGQPGDHAASLPRLSQGSGAHHRAAPAWCSQTVVTQVVS